MVARIIPFPNNGISTVRHSLADAAGIQSELTLCIQFAQSPSSLKRTVCVRADETLADLHRVITRLFGWDETHSYFFSHGSCRYEDPELFRTQDVLSARCRKIYSADEIMLGDVLAASDEPLHYVCDLANFWELTVFQVQPAAREQFG